MGGLSSEGEQGNIWETGKRPDGGHQSDGETGKQMGPTSTDGRHRSGGETGKQIGPTSLDGGHPTDA